MEKSSGGLPGTQTGRLGRWELRKPFPPSPAFRRSACHRTGKPYSSWFVSRIRTSPSSASPAPSPSARSTTTSPCEAPRLMRERMLAASIASLAGSPSRPIVTSKSSSDTAAAKMAAGRAWRPTRLAMVAVRSVIVSPSVLARVGAKLFGLVKKRA